MIAIHIKEKENSYFTLCYKLVCNVGTHDLPNMYVCTQPATLGLHTYQANRSCICHNYYM